MLRTTYHHRNSPRRLLTFDALPDCKESRLAILKRLLAAGYRVLKIERDVRRRRAKP